MRGIALLLCLLTLPAPARAQEREAVVDTVYRTARTVPADVLDAARADRAFRYTEEPVEAEGSTFWEAVIRYIGKAFGLLFHPLARPFTYLALALLLVWGVMKLLRIEPEAVLRRTGRLHRGGGAMPDALTGVAYDAEARRAREAGDTRLAVRYLFLHLLQQLDASGRIAYRPEKTNRVYLSEVGELRGAFEPFVKAFEVAWYGHVDPAPTLYDTLERASVQFMTRLNDAR